MIKENVDTKGYMKLQEPEGLELIGLDNFTLINTEERQRDNGEKDVSPELDHRLNTFAHYLHQKYLLPEFPASEFMYYNVWIGVDSDNQGFHTDFMEGYDIFFLYYFDSMKKETGGEIEFKYGDNIDTHFPKAGDLMCVNNKKGFWHRAGDVSIPRRVASFAYKRND